MLIISRILLLLWINDIGKFECSLACIALPTHYKDNVHVHLPPKKARYIIKSVMKLNMNTFQNYIWDKARVFPSLLPITMVCNTVAMNKV